MKVALICLQLGVHNTLATTAFVTAFADGLTRVGVEARIVGLVRWGASSGQPWSSHWDPGPLEPFASSAPWIAPPHARNRDADEAVSRGIVSAPGADGVRDLRWDWYEELLLERELKAFAAGEDLTAVVYPISYEVLSTVIRVANRRGWRTIVQSCEALSGSWIEPSTRDAYAEAVVRDADGVWALSSHLAEYWRDQGVPADRVIVLPNVVRQSAFEVTDPPRTSTAVYTGNLQHREVEYLLGITETVLRSMPNFTLTVYGDAPEERRRDLLRALATRGLSEAVSVEAPVAPAAIPGVLRTADVLLLPRAKGEFSQAGFPNKLGEYLASGRPVVSTCVGDVPRYLTDGDSAFLVEPDDRDAFAAAVVSALSDRARADRIGAKGADIARELLSSQVVARRILDFVDALPRRAPATTGAPDSATRAARTLKLRMLGMAYYRAAALSLRRSAGRVVRALRRPTRRR